MDFLVNYRNLDGHVVSNVTQIILDKVKADPNIARVLDCLFNPYTEINKIMEDAFAEDIRILKQAYFAANSVHEYADYDGQALSRIMDVDEDFIAEYIDQLYKTKKHFSRYDDSRDYSFIWKRDDFEQVITRVSACIYDHEKEKRLLSLTGLAVFYNLRDKDKNNSELVERQDQTLYMFIEKKNDDADFMEMVFSVIADFSTSRRMSFVFSFLNTITISGYLRRYRLSFPYIVGRGVPFQCFKNAWNILNLSCL